MEKCDVCWKELTDEESGTTLIGISITFTSDNDKLAEFVQKQLGPYKPGTYNICYECWLRSLGVIP